MPAISIPPAAMAGPKIPQQSKDVRETAENFEAVFMGQMAKLMLESVDLGDFSGGPGEEIFRGILAEKLGGEMAQRGGIGLAPAVVDQIIKLQGGAQ